MKIWKFGLPLALSAAAFLAFGATASIDPNSYLSDVKFLASPELRGRASGSPELEKAAAFLSGKYKEFGLKPATGKNYLQAFPVTTSAQLGKANQLSLVENGKTASLRCPDDYVPFNFSSSGKLAGAVVFAGYGITAPEYNYDDYSGIDAKGKLVMILRHEPQESDEASVFAGKAYTQHAQFMSKASNAKMHGAIGVLLVSDIANHKGEPDDLEKFGIAEGPTDAGIPYLHIKADRVASWFTDAGKNLETISASIDKDLKPQSFAFPAGFTATGQVDVQRLVKTVHNVAAYLPGETDE
jgi:hypothetical protein